MAKLIQVMKIVFYIFLVLSLSACALFEKQGAKEKIAGLPKPPYQDYFDASYERVWRAVQIVVSKYPIAINNLDTGIIETDTVRFHQGWQPPGYPPVPPGGKHYKINIQVARGTNPNTNKSVIRVRVTKNVYTQRDFFSSKELLESDGLEEQVILYRIGREIKIDKGLEKVYERMKKTN